jgi:alkane 1-monooxygenase
MNSEPLPPLVKPHWPNPRRLAWLFSLFVPATVALGPALMAWGGHTACLWLPVALFYLLLPALDSWLGEDRNNPPEWALASLVADGFYSAVLAATVPLLYLAHGFSAWFYVHHDVGVAGTVAMVLIGGSVGGFCINLGHELGHKSARWARWLARLVLVPSFYGHFTIEHNRGHHRDVATEHDSASSRMGESIYRFVWREMPGGLLRAWALESRRLRGLGLSAWSPRNEILQNAALSALLWAGTVWALGPAVWPYLLAVAFWSNFQLTSANYVEHYGLLRRCSADGKPEPCRPEHSWNSNHVVSNLALFHLQRHSDHHAHPARPYQALRHFEQAPQLPSGYFGMFTLAYVPPLWFRVMNPRLAQAVGFDASRIHFQPGQREGLVKQWQLREPQPSAAGA